MNVSKSAYWIGLFVMVATSFAGAQGMLNCNKNYIGPDEGSWYQQAFWDGSGLPSATDNVCIPANRTVFVVDDDDPLAVAQAGTLWLKKDDSTGERAGLNICADDFHLYGDAIVNGTLRLCKPGTLFIESSLEITGDGGDILGDVDEMVGTHVAYILLRNATLTLSGSSPNAPVEQSLLVHGNLHIMCEFANMCPPTVVDNRAYIVADRVDTAAQHQVLLVGAGGETADPGTTVIKGRGNFGAENDGHLILTAPVTGPASWEISGGNPNARIEVYHESQNLYGPVTLEDGTLILHANLTTTGNLAFSSATVTLHQGVHANFGN